jgi:epoxide hydrolase-like predicted phosphatase
MIKAIIFDVGDVLVYPNLVTSLFRSLGGSKRDLRWYRIVGHKFEKGKISEDGYFTHLSKKFGKKPEEIRSAYNKLLLKKRKRIEIYNLVEKLKKQHYELAILSNVHPPIDRHLERKGHYDPFRLRVLSHKVGYRKPEKPIYQLILKKLRMKPEEVVFIDDREEFLVTARNLGMKTILFRNSKQLKTDLKGFGVVF